jgi:hypothetical protein
VASRPFSTALLRWLILPRPRGGVASVSRSPVLTRQAPCWAVALIEPGQRVETHPMDMSRLVASNPPPNIAFRVG